ncbi:MAG: hypothetical protein U9N87_00460 [Planctomycetota bacterium]|nr:hypothetical protein [Planctomycetota bacterium]
MQPRSNFNRLLGGLGVFVILLAGCGKSGSLEYVVVSGNVSWRGKPIPRGTISFIPTGQTKGPASAAEIANGHYEVTSRGGVPVGDHRVEILATQGGRSTAEENTSPADTGASQPVQYLPPKYNRRSELQATIGSGEKKITLDFRL